MQQDDIKRKTQRNLELTSVTERDDDDVSPETTQNETDTVINRDDYINESMAILSDYITLQNQAKKDE